MGGAAMAMGPTHLDADDVQLPVPDSPFGNDLLGKITHLLNRALEERRFDALVVIEVSVHR